MIGGTVHPILSDLRSRYNFELLEALLQLRYFGHFLLVVVEDISVASTRALRLWSFQYNLKGGSKGGKFVRRVIVEECSQVQVVMPRSLRLSFAFGSFETFLLFLPSPFFFITLKCLFGGYPCFSYKIITHLAFPFLLWGFVRVYRSCSPQSRRLSRWHSGLLGLLNAWLYRLCSLVGLLRRLDRRGCIC